MALAGALPSGKALAQMAAEAGIVSDNIYRGVSLNAGAPAPVLDLSFDGSNGWYVGGSASAVRFYRQYHSSAQIVLDAGYARAAASGIAWEAGATTSVFPDFAIYDYTQVFAGLAADNWNARVYFAPDYFGRHLRTLYAEFDYAHPLGERVRLLAHVGALQELSARGGGGTPTFDASLGVGLKLRAVDVRLAWVDRSRVNYLYPVAMGDTRHTWVLSVAWDY
ncbi:MAG: TorF family putative porin [Rudaea sp.]